MIVRKWAHFVGFRMVKRSENTLFGGISPLFRCFLVMAIYRLGHFGGFDRLFYRTSFH
jgi:hypothetical protein